MYGKEELIKKIILTDLDSKDNTYKMLKKFQKDNTYVQVSTWKDCKNIIDIIDEVWKNKEKLTKLKKTGKKSGKKYKK